MQVKGSALQTIPQFITSKFGDQKLQEWISALSEPARGLYGSTILASSWYPLQEMLIAPTRLLCDKFFQGKIDGAVELGRFSAEHALKGIYKLFVKLGSAEFIIGKASTILPTFYQNSAMEVVARGNKSVTVRITRFDTPHTIVEHRIKGWIEKALEISGEKQPLATIVSSMTGGSPFTEFKVTWQ